MKETDKTPLWRRSTLTVSEAADYTGLSIPTIRAHIYLTKNGRDTFPFFTVKKSLRIHRAALDEWLLEVSQLHGELTNDPPAQITFTEESLGKVLKKKRGRPRKHISKM